MIFRLQNVTSVVAGSILKTSFCQPIKAVDFLLLTYLHQMISEGLDKCLIVPSMTPMVTLCELCYHLRCTALQI